MPQKKARIMQAIPRPVFPRWNIWIRPQNEANERAERKEQANDVQQHAHAQDPFPEEEIFQGLPPRTARSPSNIICRVKIF